jgi:phage baseplate assembly protein W|tara:strand:+ start:32 stop:427 length:396 start_codon:yes stop_codon:yes gene_type:complete
MLKVPTTVYKDFDLGFAKNPNTKDIARRVDVSAVKQSLKSLLQTQYYEKPFRPNYGSPIRGMLFQPCDMVTATTLATEIKRCIQNWEKRVIVEDVEVYPDVDNNAFSCKIYFFVRGVKSKHELGLVLDRLR